MIGRFKIKRKGYQDPLVTVVNLTATYRGSVFDFFRRRPYVFEPVLDLESVIELDEGLDGFSAGGLKLFEWLASNAKGSIKFESRFVYNFLENAVRVANHLPPTHRVKIKVSFSDPKLAMLWKLTFGGKLVDDPKRSNRTTV